MPPDTPGQDASPSADPGIQEGHAGNLQASHRGRHSGWNVLLLLPIVLSLLTPFYNRDEPRLFGFPAFYWLQLSFVVVGVASTTIVYQLTKRRD